MLAKVKDILPEKLHPEVTAIIERYSLSPLQLAHFLAQCHHESGGWKQTEENLNYSKQGLLKVFHKYFKTVNPDDYAHHPEKIANRVYAMRLGNGRERDGDGWRYRGRGYIQLTGKENYARFGSDMKVDFVAQPDRVATEYPLSSAAWFFDSNRIWKWCAVGDTRDAVVDVTKRVNGGLIGLDDRVKLFDKYWSALK